MQIQRRILRTYFVLIGIVLGFFGLISIIAGIRGTIQTERNALLELRNTWAGAQIAVSDIIIDWNNGRPYQRLLHHRRDFSRRLQRTGTSTPTIWLYPPQFSARFVDLEAVWRLADEHLEQIVAAVEHPDFQAVDQEVRTRPGLQRLSHLWVELADGNSLRERRLAHSIQRLFGEVEYFSLYSETMDNLFDVILREADTAQSRIIVLERIAGGLFFLIFLAAYGLISRRFAQQLSQPIIRIAEQLRAFIGRTGTGNEYEHNDEVVYLSQTVDFLIQHYTDLSERTSRLARGHIQEEGHLVPAGGVVARSLNELATYLYEFARTSSWIRKGNYGAHVEERSPEDILAQNFNFMSSVVREKIATLQGMFDAVDEGVLLVDSAGTVRELNRRILLLCGIPEFTENPTPVLQEQILPQLRHVLEKTLAAGGTDNTGEHFVNLTTIQGRTIPAKVIARVLYGEDDHAPQVMFLVVDESWRARQHRERERYRAHAALAELRALRAQINPHFLFNTLNTIAYLVESDTDHAIQTIENLAELFRYALFSTDHDSVPLHDEVRHTRRFLDIEQARHEERLKTTFEIDHSLRDVQVQPMLLQPLVENAVRYGGDDGGTVDVTIRAVRHDGNMHLTVEDRGIAAIDPGTLLQRSGTGIRNVNSRLKTLYGRQLQYRRNNPRGLVAEIVIPIGVE